MQRGAAPTTRYFALADSCGLPVPAANGGQLEVHFSPWGSARSPSTARGAYGFRHYDVDHARWRARPTRASGRWPSSCAARSTDPYDYVRKVIARVQRGARYTENPPPPGSLAPLDAFLFRDRAGYCQHFAGRDGAAAAHGRRARARRRRVLAGLDATAPTTSSATSTPTAGSRSTSRSIGWVTFDPTPGDSPARSQQTDTLAVKASTPAPQAARRRRATAPSDPTAGGSGDAASAGGGGAPAGRGSPRSSWSLARSAVARARRRRARRLAPRGDPELEELRLALRALGPRAAPTT